MDTYNDFLELQYISEEDSFLRTIDPEYLSEDELLTLLETYA